KRGSPFPQVLRLRTALVRTIEGRVRDSIVGNRHAEAIAEHPQVLLVHLLLLMRDVLALAGLAETLALDGAREDDGRSAAMRNGGAVRVVHLERIVSADAQLLELVVREMTYQLEEPRIDAPEMLAQIPAVLDGVALVFAIDDFPHPLHEHAVGVAGQQVVPVGSPQHFDDVP